MNGYEIRLKILEMAKEIADQEFMMKREPILNEYYMKLDKIRENPDYNNVILPKIPEYPTLDYITSIANTLNNFVNVKS